MENAVSEVSGKVFHKRKIFLTEIDSYLGIGPEIQSHTTMRNGAKYFAMCPIFVILCKVATAVEVTYMDCSTVAGCTATPRSKSFSNHASKL